MTHPAGLLLCDHGEYHQEDHMAERALRGSRLGAQSYETDAGIEMAPRQSVTYDCANGHRFAMPFSLEADIPEVWECTVCGAEALRVDGTRPEPKQGKPARTHWDMLLERRSVKELEVLLAERLEQLRAGAVPGKTRAGAGRAHRKSA
jgi:rubredoxin